MSPTGEIIMNALRKLFSRGGVPTIPVTDNRTRFVAEALGRWLKCIVYWYLLTPTKYPYSKRPGGKFCED